MRLAGPRCRVSRTVAVFLATAVGVAASGVALVSGLAAPAAAAVAPLTIGVDQSLCLVNEAIGVTVEGQVDRSLIGTKLVVRVKGPADLSQIGESNPELPEAFKIVQVLGETPAVIAGPPPSPEVPTTTTTTLVSGMGNTDELASGVLAGKATIPPGTPSPPGAYLLVVEVKAGNEVVANGGVWVGRVAQRDTPLDLAFVWPVSLGIHRNSEGFFYTDVLEQAAAPSYRDSGGLRAVAGLGERFPDWNFTLAIEPVLLTQLRDMADGYVRIDASGSRVEMGDDSVPARNAAAVLTAFSGAVARGSAEIVAGPYSGADLGILAAAGWRDGFEQIQLGKQELQQTLGLESVVTGAFSPDLGLTAGSLSYYAAASIDHVVVRSGLAESLTEEVADGIVAVRARNVENDRVTLVFADAGLSALMIPPWDPGVFFAALAAELAISPRDAIVATPAVEFTIPPAEYLEGIGQTLEGREWVRTQTLTALLRSHSPDTRPIMLSTSAGGAQGYVEESLLESIAEAHAAVSDLGTIADPTRAPVETSHRLLFIAESRWWSRADTSPEEATIGLVYAERAEELARSELDKVRILQVESDLITGDEGVVDLVADNGTNYPVTVELHLGGEGLTFPLGEEMEVELAPGRTTVSVRVVRTDRPERLTARLVGGENTLDEVEHSLRFFSFVNILPWLILVVLVCGGGAYGLLRWRPWKRGADQSA